MHTRVPCETHEDQGCVQVFIVLLHELLIVLLCLPAVGLKEPSLVIFISWQHTLFLTTWQS